jgi:hypothetical protein
VESPAGVAVDPGAGKIYWANFHNPGGSISWANLNESGGGNLTTTGATVEGPEGVAVDPVAGRIYWGNYHGTTISLANLNGSGGGELSTTGATVSSPSGLAIDPVTRRIYWANSTNPGGGISWAHLDGSGGGNLPTMGATVIDPAFPALLEAPSGSAEPTITPTTSVITGSMQTCGEGSWAPDEPSEFFYRAPQSYSFSWQRNGVEIPGTGAETFTPTQPGLYTCSVTATNYAGSSTETSAPLQIKASNAFTIGEALKGFLWVNLSSAGAVRVAAYIHKFTYWRPPHPNLAIKPSTASGGPGALRVRLKLTRFGRRALRRTGRLKFKASVTFTPIEGDAKTKVAVLRLRSARKHRH